MAPRAYWKGFLRLSLVSCPIQLFPATSEREKISFNQINKETGNRIRYRKVDEDTGEEWPKRDDPCHPTSSKGDVGQECLNFSDGNGANPLLVNSL